MPRKRATLNQVSGRLDQVTHGLAAVTGRVDHLTGTVDHLAAMVATSFQSLQDEMRAGFGAVNKRLDDHDVRLVRIERKLDNTIERVNNHDVRLGRLESTGNA